MYLIKGGEKNLKLKNLFRRNKNKKVSAVTVDDFNAYLEMVGGYQTLDKNPDVRIAVDRIADLVSNMTIQLWENNDTGDIRISDGLARKIDIEPCKNMTRKTWIYKIVEDLLLNGDGNSILYVETNQKEELIENLVPIPMSQVTYQDLKNGDYRIKCGHVTYNSDEVVHFAINPHPTQYYRGRGYRIYLNDIVENLNQATKTKNGFMRNKNIPNLIIKVDATSDEFTSEEGRQKIYKKYFESNQSGMPWIIPDDMIEITQVKPLSLKDIAINEGVEIDKKTVAGLIGCPAFFLGVGKFNKEEYNNFIDTKIMSIAKTIAQTLTRDILLSPNRYFKMNPRSLHSYNLTELVSSGSQMVQLAAMRRNELRNWVGLAPDPEMQEIIVLENYLNQEDLSKQNKLKGGEEKKDDKDDKDDKDE